MSDDRVRSIQPVFVSAQMERGVEVGERVVALGGEIEVGNEGTPDERRADNDIADVDLGENGRSECETVESGMWLPDLRTDPDQFRPVGSGIDDPSVDRERVEATIGDPADKVVEKRLDCDIEIGEDPQVPCSVRIEPLQEIRE